MKFLMVMALSYSTKLSKKIQICGNLLLNLFQNNSLLNDNMKQDMDSKVRALNASKSSDFSVLLVWRGMEQIKVIFKAILKSVHSSFFCSML